MLGQACSSTAMIYAMHQIKVACVTVAIVMSALRARGLSGYRRDGDFSIGRHLRDVLSSPIMINNERILENLATSSLMTPIPTSSAIEPWANLQFRRLLASIHSNHSRGRCFARWAATVCTRARSRGRRGQRGNPGPALGDAEDLQAHPLRDDFHAH